MGILQTINLNMFEFNSNLHEFITQPNRTQMGLNLTETLLAWSKIYREKMNIYRGGKNDTCNNKRKDKEVGVMIHGMA